MSELAFLLTEIEKNDKNYEIRERYIMRLIGVCAVADYKMGLYVDDGWSVIAIELPGVGQVSWHMNPKLMVWDGHDTEEKYRRTRLWCKNNVCGT